MEDSLIAEEILPAISESVAPVLGSFATISPAVDYDPEGGITVKTTRGEVVVKENTAKKYEIPKTHKVVKVAEAQHVEGEEDKPQKSKKIERSPNTGLCVWLPNGEFIQAKKANLTMVEAVKWAGVKAVAALGLPHDGDYLVSKKEHPKYAGCVAILPNGYLLNTHSSTMTRKYSWLNFQGFKLGMSLDCQVRRKHLEAVLLIEGYGREVCILTAEFYSNIIVRMKSQSHMRVYISVRIWKINLSFTIRLF